MPERSPHPVYFWLTRGLAAGALGLSVYLLTATLATTPLAGCGGGSGCSNVLASRWSHWLGLPVSGGAVAVYGVVLAVLWLGRGGITPRRWVWPVLFVLAAVIASAAIWFIALQAVVLRSFCIYCLTTHAIGLVLAALIWLPASLPARRKITLTTAGLGLTAVLIIGQIAVPPVTYRTVTYGDVGINIAAYPRSGASDAPHVLFLFFDYTCPNCRTLHGYIQKLLQRHPGQIVVALAAVPLDAACNPEYLETDQTHQNACAYAKLSLAVWRYAPDKFPAYDLFLNQGITPPPLAQARQKAIDLIGQTRLDQSLIDPWPQQFIQTQIKLNALLRQKARQKGVALGDGVPTMIVDQNFLIAGRPDSAKEFLALMEKQMRFDAK